MIRIAIVEDNIQEADSIKTLIERYALETSVEIRTQHFKNGVAFLESYKQDYDVILMDIEMPGMNGIETARRLRERNREVPLIFITNMAQYAIQGYEVDAMGFFIKPVRYADLYYRLKKAILLVNTHQATISVKTENGAVLLNVTDIQYLEVDNVYVTYYTWEGEYKSRITLTMAEAALKEYGNFVRCNNCYLVNLEYVTGVQGDSVIVAGTKLLMSRHKKKDFLNALTAYIGGKK